MCSNSDACSTNDMRCHQHRHPIILLSGQQVAVYNGVREIVALGQQSKLASSKRRRRDAKRRRSADSNSGGGTTGSISASSTSSRKRRNNAVGHSNGNTLETEEQAQEQDEDNPRGQQPSLAEATPDGGAGTPSGADADTGAASDPGASNIAGSTVREAGEPEDGQAAEDGTLLPPGEESRATAVPPSVPPNGGGVVGHSGHSGDNGDGGGDGDDPFALLSPDKLATFDIVLTTFEVLRAEVHHAESKFADILGKGGGGAAAGRPSLRRKKR